jgi:predicted RNase H-like HicB family nuclease
MSCVYPVCFYPDEKGVTVVVPDLPGCVTEGNNITEAISMAEDAIEGWLYTSMIRGEEIPQATPFQEVRADEYPNGFVSYVRADVDSFIESHFKKFVKKKCTIPEWLYTRAKKEGIDFSFALQEQIKRELGIKENPFL